MERAVESVGYGGWPPGGRPAWRAERQVLAESEARRYLHPAHPLVTGNRWELLHDGLEAFPSMLRAIRSARYRVRLETYIFADDAVGQAFARELVAAAARGVKVEVLYDWLGSWLTRRSFFRELRAAGVDARAFNPLALLGGVRRLLCRDHRKLLAVDGEVAFVGGVNIGAQWAPRGLGAGWRDDVLRIEGPAAARLERRFCATWRLEWKTRLKLWVRRRGSASGGWPGGVGLCVLSSRRAIHAAYLRAIRAATRSVLIAAAYFVPDRAVVRALEEAATRGVEVVLVLSGTSDHPWIQYASRALYGRLFRSGVRIYEWPHGVLHAKTAVVDGTWGTVGSFNLEGASRRLNHELNVVFADPEAGRQLEQALRADCARCRAIDPVSWNRRPRWRRLLERLACAVGRIL